MASSLRAAARALLPARSAALPTSPAWSASRRLRPANHLYAAPFGSTSSPPPSAPAAAPAPVTPGDAPGPAAGGPARLAAPVDSAAFHAYTVQDLMRARVHLGHRTQFTNAHMAPYLLGSRNGTHIIDLDQTAGLLRRALTAASLMAEHDCTFLWLGPRDPHKARIVERQAVRAGAYTINGARWIGGTLTNPIKSGQARRFNYRVPDCVFIVDTNRHMPALREARTVGIPTIGVVDSDCDPSLVTYPIPGNDDAALAIYLYCSLMGHAILDGRRRGRRLNRPSLQVPVIEPPRHTRSRRPRS